MVHFHQILLMQSFINRTKFTKHSTKQAQDALEIIVKTWCD